MKKDYINFYLAFSDIKKLKQDTWYPVPVNPLKREFVEWYYRETMAIEFSANKTHFMVKYYPTEAEKNRVLSIMGYVAPVSTKGERVEVVHNPAAIMDPNKFIPGVDKESKCPIVAKILESEKAEIESKNKKHKDKMEFLRRKREFMGMSEDDDL